MHVIAGVKNDQTQHIARMVNVHNRQREGAWFTGTHCGCGERHSRRHNSIGTSIVNDAQRISLRGNPRTGASGTRRRLHSATRSTGICNLVRQGLTRRIDTTGELTIDTVQFRIA